MVAGTPMQKQGGVTMTENLHQKVTEGYTQSTVWLAALNFNLKPGVGKPVLVFPSLFNQQFISNGSQSNQHTIP